MSDEIEFIDGLMFKEKHQNAPDFVICKLSIKREELIAWLQAKDGEWINGDIKRSKQGKLYAAVDNWKPDRGKSQTPAERQQQSAPQQAPLEDIDGDSIPF